MAIDRIRPAIGWQTRQNATERLEPFLKKSSYRQCPNFNDRESDSGGKTSGFIPPVLSRDLRLLRTWSCFELPFTKTPF